MLRKTLITRATEFSSNTVAGQRWPHAVNGMTYLFNGRKRRFWLRAVLLETSDKTRAVNHRARYGDILDQIDKDKTTTEKELDINDLRTDDHRRVWFTCPKCGDSYQRTMKGRTHYRKGCRRYCDTTENNPLLYPTTAGVSNLKTIAAEGKSSSTTVLDRLQLFSESGNKEKLAETPAWSAGKFKIKCVDCDNIFETYLRSVTGAHQPGGVVVQDKSNALLEVQNRCQCCRHKFLMKRARENMGEKGSSYYGGLSFS